MNHFRFLQCNIQSLSRNKDELQKTLTVGDYSAVLLSETWTNQSLEQTSKYNISRYHRFVDSRVDNYGGSAIYLKQDLGYKTIKMPLLSNATQAVAIQVCTLDMVIVAIYIAPSITKIDLENDLAKIFDSIKNHSRVLIGGDFNSHHHAWGNDFTDAKGSIVMNFINDNNLILLNDNSKTFIPLQLNKKSTAIDLTLFTPNIFTNFEWKTLDFGIGSHHLIIELNFICHAIDNRKYVYNHKK